MSKRVIYQILTDIGTGMILNTLLLSFQAGQPESDQATATVTWVFTRSFGCIWGVTIPVTMFNNLLEKSSGRTGDFKVQGELISGQAYWHSTHD
jgi:hypothetical protein